MRTCSLCLILCAGLAVAASTPTAPALTYSTYLRDNFRPAAMATDSSGNLYLAGNTTVDPAASQTTVLVIKLNPQANQFLYLRYLGGAVPDAASAIAVDAAGNAYIAGGTQSPDFPVTAGGHLGTPPTTGLPRSFETCSRHRSQLAFCRPARTVVARQLCAGSASNYPPRLESCSALIPIDGCTYARESDAQEPRSELPAEPPDPSALRIPDERAGPPACRRFGFPAPPEFAWLSGRTAATRFRRCCGRGRRLWPGTGDRLRSVALRGAVAGRGGESRDSWRE